MVELIKFISYFFCECLVFNQSVALLILSALGSLIIWFIIKIGQKDKHEISIEEEDELLKEFVPNPLIGDLKEELIGKPRIVQGRVGKYVTVDGMRCLNFATHNYLGFVDDPEVIQKTAECISQYGVGSCGPRGFYGTADVHMELEEKIAEFMGVEETCVYSYGFSTAASAIPAYCKRRDVIFADSAVNFAIQKGLDASRSTIKYFHHNDTKHLESLLVDYIAANKGNKQRVRLFLVVEGIYQNTGTICPLPELVQLRAKYQMRMFLDESVSIGTIGATGKGVVEYYGVDDNEIDLRIGSMEGAFASIGGFCCGSSFIVEHQRLNGLGYCFSAALPPLLAVAALTALSHLRKVPDQVKKLNEVSKLTHQALSALPNLILSGHELSPIKHLYLDNSTGYKEDIKVLHRVADECFRRGLAVLPPSYLPTAEKFPPRASLRVVTNAQLTADDTELLRTVLYDIAHNIQED